MLKLLIHILHILLTRCPAAGWGVVRRGFGKAFIQTALNPVESDRPGSRRSLDTTVRRTQGRAIALFLLLIGIATPSSAFYINNTAQVDLTFGIINVTDSSNNVTVTGIPAPSIAKVEFLHLNANPSGTTIPATSFSSNGTETGTFDVILPTPGPADLTPTQNFSGSEYAIIRLTDADRNLDTLVTDEILLTVSSATTGDSEHLLLSETGPDTGIFLGALPLNYAASVDFDGQLFSALDDTLTVNYLDPINGDGDNDTALVDPLGTVFDSRTGAPVNEATINLYRLADLNDKIGILADGNIFDDDGTTPFPASLISGDIAHSFPAGGFRFPLVEPGYYRLEVIPPGNYAFPSTATIPASFSYMIVNGSRGEAFEIAHGPVINIDIPIDPLDGEMWLEKKVNRNQASVGDFLQYRLTLENLNTAATVPQAVINDRLPLGFRYQKDSTRIDGTKMSDPQIGVDGRQLTFVVGDLPPASQKQITYVVEVAAGARTGKAVNQAQAVDAYNNRTALIEETVEVREEFFRNSTFLLGRVLVGTCSEPDTDKTGLAGVRIYMEDGSYVVTDEDGKYHFEGVYPGVHVVQVDTFSLPVGYEMLPCEQTSQSAGRSFSQFVDLQGGTLWQVNFHTSPLPAPTGEATLALRASLEGEVATFTATAATQTVPADNLNLAVMLPGGFSYLPGTSLRDGESTAEPHNTESTVEFSFPLLAADTETTFSFQARLEGNSASGELPAKAVLSFDTPGAKGLQTPPAETRFQLLQGQPGKSEEVRLYPRFPSFATELQATDRAMLEELVQRLEGQEIARLDIVGHTDSQKIASKSKHIFADNQALSTARAENISIFLRERLDIASDIISVRGMGANLPVADNKTEAGRSLNRRVELYLVAKIRKTSSSLSLSLANDEAKSVLTTGLTPAAQSPTTGGMTDSQANTSSKEFKKGLLSPVSNKAVNRVESIRIRLDSTLELRASIDQQEIPEDRLGFRMDEPDSNTTLYTYIGVDLGEPGVRTLLIEGIGPFGNVRFKQETKLIRNAEIASIRLLETADNIADGRTPVRIRVELIDKFGRLVQTKVNLSLESTELHSLSSTQKDKFKDTDDLRVGKQVSVDSQGWISFKPVEQSKGYPIQLSANETTLATKVYVKPHMRDWILVGFAEGTVGYNNLTGNQVSLDEAGLEDDFYTDDRVKFFAKGAIKGEWLLTMAYDSKKPNSDGSSLHQSIDPDSYYPLYGDGTQQGYEAASSRKLYVKLERDQFYALFGDMETGLTQTELSQYSRSMNGIKSEMQGETFSYTLFAADTKQAFAKDEIRGDGTSGRYYLTQKSLVTNSETISIETRDRFHSEQVLDVQTLARHTDYDIDYDAGSLFFKRPIASKDENFNPIYIVVNYETLDSTETNLNYGGRVAAKFIDQKIEVGASYVHEEKGVGEGDLYGADVTIKLTPQTTLHAEAAETETSQSNVGNSGNAYLAGITHESEKIRGEAYYREQQAGFGLGQQNGSETGTRKYGARSAYKLTSKMEVAGEAYHQDNLTSGAKRDVAELQGRYASERYGLHTGLREARDQFETGTEQRSSQWLIGGNWATSDRKLNLRGDYEQSLLENDENSDFPTLLRLGADYRLTEKVGLFVEQEFSWGAEQNTDGTRAGFNATPWQGADLRTTVEQQTNENSQRVFALFGLGQSWQMNERWSFDANIDRSHTIKEPSSERLNDEVPAAHGTNNDFTAVSVGATRRVEKWTWWNRLETRQADSEEKYGVSTSVVGEPQDGVAVSVKALAFITKVTNGATRTDGNIRLGVAYRPTTSRWIMLNRLDFYFDQEDHSATEYDNWRIVNHLHANFRANRKVQMSFYYGLKYVRDNFNGSSYSGFTDMIAFETRYNLNKRWDVGLRASMLHSWNSGQTDYSLGGDIGYSPMTNTWISLGYNLVGFNDKDFSAANYTAEGAYLKFRAKFDQQSVREAAEWINR